MSVLIDTNILVYAVHGEAPEHKAAREYVERQKRGVVFFVTWSILYEWLRITTHPKVFTKPLVPEQATQFVLKLANDPKVDVLTETPHHARFLSQVLKDIPVLRGNLYHDAHIATLMREHGIVDIATADRHFRFFSFLNIIDPVNLNQP